MKCSLKKFKFLIFTFLLSSLIFSGCSKEIRNNEKTNSKSENIKSEQSLNKKVVDSVGREVEIPKKVEKVVTVGPVGVQNCFIFAMGEGDKIGNGLPPRFTKNDRWKYHKVFNPEIVDKPIVEDAEGVINMEKLVEIKPDLVFTMDEKTADDLEDKGLKAIVLSWKDPEDVKEVVNLLGQIFNKPERAKEYSEYFDDTIKKVEDIVSKIPKDERKKVLNTSLEKLSMGHAIAEWWIEKAGGISVTKDDRVGETSNYSLEQLISWDPDVLFVQTPKDIDLAKSDERFKGLKAVEKNQIYSTPVFGHVWANRTMEQPLTVLWAAKNLYPEEMKNIDMNEELKKFSKKFFEYELSDAECNEILGGI